MTPGRCEITLGWNADSHNVIANYRAMMGEAVILSLAVIAHALVLSPVSVRTTLLAFKT